eukprot:765161-Hanusia_phi.AAC.1
MGGDGMGWDGSEGIGVQGRAKMTRRDVESRGIDTDDERDVREEEVSPRWCKARAARLDSDRTLECSSSTGSA